MRQFFAFYTDRNGNTYALNIGTVTLYVGYALAYSKPQGKLYYFEQAPFIGAGV